MFAHSVFVHEGKTMTQNQITPQIGSTPATTKPARLGDLLTSQLGTLLGDALTDATSLEIRTFTSEAQDAALAGSDDPLAEHTRLRAFTRIAMDGDTQQCIPLLASGEPDAVLWSLHSDAVDQARKDRAASVDLVISTLAELAKR